MTCSQADEGCPFIAGAEVRIPITFEDPKNQITLRANTGICRTELANSSRNVVCFFQY